MDLNYPTLAGFAVFVGTWTASFVLERRVVLRTLFGWCGRFYFPL